MRSRAELRVAAEWLARVAVIAVLAIALWRTTRVAAGTSTARSIKAWGGWVARAACSARRDASVSCSGQARFDELTR